MRLFKRKPIDHSRENLVLYNLDRVKNMILRLEKDKGEYDLLHNYDSIISALDFIKRDVERNYNINASLKCDYCDKVFTGWKAYSNQAKHKIEAHPDEVHMFRAIVSSAILDVGLKAMDSLTKSIHSESSKDGEG